MTAWLDCVNREVLAHYNTTISGGFDEPFYRAPVGTIPAEIQYTQDYERSALHELAHWCVAGEQRRMQDDYGYWYAPDGRSNEQQQLFFRVEVIPQAIEKCFCMTLGIPFDVSMDNLGNSGIEGLDGFRAAVHDQYCDYIKYGLPERAATIDDQLARWRKG